MKKGKHLTSEQIDYLIRHYPHTNNNVLASEMGISVHTIKSRAYSLGLHKSKEYRTELYRQIAKDYNNAERLNTPNAIAKRGETIKRQYVTDHIRANWGMEPATKRHIRLEPRGKLLQRNRLQRLGYIIDETNLIAYWTPGTHRATRLEAQPRGITKGSIHAYYSFAPYGEQ